MSPVMSPAEALGLEVLPPTLTASQTAALLGISKQTVYRAHAAGELPGFKVRGRLVIPTRMLLAHMGLDASAPSRASISSTFPASVPPR